jgi:plastocyanin
MKLITAGALTLALFGLPISGNPNPGPGSISGKVTFQGIPPKTKPLDLSKEPECVKMHSVVPLLPETVMIGSGNSLRNVVVYISAGPPDSAAVRKNPATFEQKDCHYTTHVLAVQAGQEITIINNDPLSHNIHPLARVNREWNKIQPANTPAFSYAYDKEEFISVKCNLHSWMQGYFAVLRNNHFAVTGDDGRFFLPDLPPGHYTITAWHESFGTQSKELVIGGGETQTVDFVFKEK